MEGAGTIDKSYKLYICGTIVIAFFLSMMLLLTHTALKRAELELNISEDFANKTLFDLEYLQKYCDGNCIIIDEDFINRTKINSSRIKYECWFPNYNKDIPPICKLTYS